MAKCPLTDRPEPRPERPGGHGYDNAILQVQASIVIERWLLEVPGAAEAVNAAVRAHIRATALARGARRARLAAVEASRAHAAAVMKLELCIDGIRQTLLSWALSSVAPAKVDRASWVAALEQAVAQLLPPS